MEEEIYCLKCKKRTPNSDVTYTETQNRILQKTKCVVCGTKKNRFVKKNIK